MFCQLEYNHWFSNSEYFLKGHTLDSNWEQNCGTVSLYSVDWWRRGQIDQRTCPAGESASIPFLVSVLYKVSSNWTQISIMTWTKKKTKQNKTYRYTAPLSIYYLQHLQGTRDKTGKPGTTWRAKEWWLPSCLFKDIAVDGPASPQT